MHHISNHVLPAYNVGTHVNVFSADIVQSYMRTLKCCGEGINEVSVFHIRSIHVQFFKWFNVLIYLFSKATVSAIVLGRDAWLKYVQVALSCSESP